MKGTNQLLHPLRIGWRTGENLAEPETFLYLRPTAVLRGGERTAITLTPRIWTYVGDLTDNPDIEDYRGYADLRAIVGWAEDCSYRLRPAGP